MRGKIVSVARTRILLADDNFALLEMVAKHLGKQFDIVGKATNGVQMVADALRLHPDLIVADITMPEMNGLDAASKLRESGCRSKVVYLTVHSEPEFVKACLEQGALGYVLKARLKSHLLPAIRAALDGQVYVSPLNFK